MLTGNSAKNILKGLGGNDTYVVTATDVVDESAAGSSGIDTVQSAATFSLANTAQVLGAVENLTLTGSAAVNGTGNALNNVLTGNSAKNILQGLGGNDIYVVRQPMSWMRMPRDQVASIRCSLR